LPLSIRKKLNLTEGDYLDVRVEDGEVILKAKKLIDKDQAWFWSQRWQQGEEKAQSDINAGRVNKFTDAKSVISFLHKETSKKQTGKKQGKS
jgi:AbrB family looped-hinge helix DNA binding protein